jgi:hypothetical protein
VFVFPKESLAQPNAKGEISATALIGRESFPELLPAIYAAYAVNWPPVIQDEHCQMPTSIGEDYAGPSCTGTVVETAKAAGNQVKIVLNLQLNREGSVGTASFFIG